MGLNEDVGVAAGLPVTEMLCERDIETEEVCERVTETVAVAVAVAVVPGGGGDGMTDGAVGGDAVAWAEPPPTEPDGVAVPPAPVAPVDALALGAPAVCSGTAEGDADGRGMNTSGKPGHTHGRDVRPSSGAAYAPTPMSVTAYTRTQ